MNRNSRILPAAVGLAATALLAAAAAPQGRADTPPPAPPAMSPENDAAVEAQFQAAQKQLEQATREVARLSEQMSGAVIDKVMPYLSTGHALIGVQLDATEDSAGARVHEVSPGGPAAEAGMRPGDVITAVNGTSVAGPEPARHVTRLLREVKPDSQVRIRVLRDGTPRELTLTARAGPSLLVASALPDLAYAFPGAPGTYLFRRPLGDMELATLSAQLGSYFGTDKGVLVIRAPGDGALKLQDGDVILSIDGREPTSGSHATRILGSYQPGEKIALRVLRQHKTLEFQSTLPERDGPLRRGALQRERERGELPATRARPVLFGNGEA